MSDAPGHVPGDPQAPSRDAPAGKVLYIDYAQCIGCETCETVCGFLHDAPRVHMTRTRDGVLVPLYCRHCEKAHCIRACPRGALARDRDGAVVLSPLLCRGCQTRDCTQGCPYAAMVLTSKGVAVRKCDLCAERRALGQEPACAAMCPTGAIHYVDRHELPDLETPQAREAEKRVMAHLKPSTACVGGLCPAPGSKPGSKLGATQDGDG